MSVGALMETLDSLDWFPLLVLAYWSAIAYLSTIIFMPLVTMGIGITEILDGREPILPQRNIRCAW